MRVNVVNLIIDANAELADGLTRLAEQDAAGIALGERSVVADVDSHIIEPADLTGTASA